MSTNCVYIFQESIDICYTSPGSHKVQIDSAGGSAL